MVSQFHKALPATEKGDAAVPKLTGNYLREANKRVGCKAKKSATPPDEQSSRKTFNTSVAVGDLINDEAEETGKKRSRSEIDEENGSEEEEPFPVKNIFQM